MKHERSANALRSMLALILLCSIFLMHRPVPAEADFAKVTVYEYANQKGKSTYYVNNAYWQYSSSTPGIGDNTISCITVSSGLQVVLLDTTITGKSLTFPAGTYNLADYGFDKKTSGLIVRSIKDTNAEKSVVFYSDINENLTNFNAGTIRTTASQKDLTQLKDAKSNWNDRISCIFVPEGYRVTIFEHIGYGGSYRTLYYGVWNMTKLSLGPGKTWNDQISSYMITKV